MVKSTKKMIIELGGEELLHQIDGLVNSIDDDKLNVAITIVEYLLFELQDRYRQSLFMQDTGAEG